MRKAARILFDESHSQAWTIRHDLAQQIQPSHPEDSSYAQAAAALRSRDFAVEAWTSAPLDGVALAGADVLVIAHPSEARWEKVVPGGSPVFTDSELDAIEAFVRRGGGLVLLGETEQEKYGSNLNALAARFGVTISNETVSDYENHLKDTPHWVLADLDARRGAVDLLARVQQACFYRAATLRTGDGAQVLARALDTSSAPGAPLAAAVTHGLGRVVVLADSDLFGDDCLDALDHRELWLNIVHWVAAARFATQLDEPRSPALGDDWTLLKQSTDALRLLQRADGSVDLEVHQAAEVTTHVASMRRAIAALAAHFPHQAGYIAALDGDLEAWVDDGFAVPDFTAALDAFRPDLTREDGIEHLVVFPMYKQNGSRDKVFEALIVRVPWPQWLAELERTRYDNAKFVPVTLVDNTAGYDSECAVLFPETVSIAGAPANHFGAIFCDREAARFRARVGEAAAVLKLNLPPDAAALLSSESLSRDAYELWDLVHDRSHSHGDLPFDPFMIRQRMPFWMYSLEELRCDLTAFAEAAKLEAEGFAFARHAQYAILMDRLFRFPITGSRVRNYDGLGGQLLFAFLHKTGRVRWTDNQLTIDWDDVAAGVAELRERVEDLYRTGIDRTKLAHWAAAHDLVAEFVQPAAGSRWARGTRAFEDVSDPRAYIDEVLDDEFPLSLFFVSLQSRLATLDSVAA
jgi:hypothetical protein